ncbi:TonB-dependent receptor [Bacteroides pyogenes JCM 10003]|nr:TonB-dependent receptor [Bacteroides pyogenes JCM 10003]
MMKQFICSALFLLPFGLSATDLDTVAVKRIALEEVTVVSFKQDKLNRSPLSVFHQRPFSERE